MSELSFTTAWTFIREVKVPKDIDEILVKEEKAIAAYATIRDVAIITNKRIIIKDKQGLTGKKIEIYTIPFKSIVLYSSENAGTLDFNSELELWTRVGRFKINLKKGVNIRKLDKIIAEYIL